jgi:hypothetical protein
MKMELREVGELQQSEKGNKLAKYKTLRGKQVDKALRQDTLDTEWYKVLTTFRYGVLKGYKPYETVMFEIAEHLLCLELRYLLLDDFRKNQVEVHCAIAMNSAYRMGIRPLWLSMPLTRAFSQSRLPGKISSLNKISPVVLIFFPEVIKNPNGKYLKWVLFYHKKPGDPFLPLIFDTAKIVNDFSQSEDFDREYLYWCTKLGDDGTYAGCQQICIEDDKFFVDGGEYFSYDKNGKASLNEGEESFANKVTDLIIQTLLYMQMEKTILPPIPAPQPLGFGRKGKTKYKKIPTLIIGENYLIKTQRESTGESRPHGSPVTHWRSGHWRCQPYGSKDKPDYKTIWIEPILVNKPGG